MSSLPVPVSPLMSTAESVGATVSTWTSTRRIFGLEPTSRASPAGTFCPPAGGSDLAPAEGATLTSDGETGTAHLSYPFRRIPPGLSLPPVERQRGTDG